MFSSASSVQNQQSREWSLTTSFLALLKRSTLIKIRVSSCGHLLTLEDMDGHMSMPDYYFINDEGSIVGLKSNIQPFSTSGMKNCPMCRGPLRNVNRYSRAVR